jgi:hypothetical protein
MVATLIGLSVSALGAWPMFLVVVPDRLEAVSRICALVLLPGIMVALAIGEGVHTYSRGVVFLGSVLFYSAVVTVLLTCGNLLARRRRAS